MKIYPLAMTQVHWPTFIKVVKEELGYSPTRGIDDSGIKPEDPQAYLACLDLENSPLRQLRSGNHNNTWRHVSASFLAVMTPVTATKLFAGTDLAITAKHLENGEILAIITGDMKQWRDAIIYGCEDQTPKNKDIRGIFNYCLVYFQEAGFREVWYDCDKVGLEDGTFTIKKVR